MELFILDRQILFLVNQIFVKRKNIKSSFKIVHVIWNNIICREIRIKQTRKMAEQPSSELATGVVETEALRRTQWLKGLHCLHIIYPTWVIELAIQSVAC